MSNMSYCRFHNTVGDFQDCVDALDEMRDGMEDSKLSRGELRKAKELVVAALELIENLAELVDCPIEDLEAKDLEEAVDYLQECATTDEEESAND